MHTAHHVLSDLAPRSLLRTLSALLLVLPVTAQVPAEAPRGLVHASDAVTPGYVLYAPLKSKQTYLVDRSGRVVHTWSSEYSPGNAAYLLDDGSLLRAGRVDNDHMHGGGQGGRVQRLTWEGEVSWELEWADDQKMAHHDLEPLPNGNVLVLAWEMKTRAEALSAGRDPTAVAEGGFWPDAVFEVRPVGASGYEVVWEWHAWDHLIQDFDPEAEGYGDVPRFPGRIDLNGDHRHELALTAEERVRLEELERDMRALGYVGEDEEEPLDPAAPGGAADPDADGDGRRLAGDWLHTNSIDYDLAHDLILLSVRTLNEVWVIDHSTTTAQARGRTGGRFEKGGDLLYRWGNPRMYAAGSEADRRLFHQHDASWVSRPDGTLGILVFNNGDGRPAGAFSSVEELSPPFDAASGFGTPAVGEAFGPRELAWSYEERDDFYSSFISGAQRLPGGNTLICEGAEGRLFEVDPSGAIVWDYLVPHGGEAEAGPRGPGPGAEGRPPEGRRGPPPAGRGPGADGQPPGADRPRAEGGPGEPRPGGGRRTPMGAAGLFRGTYIAPEHPGLKGKDLSSE